MADQSAREIIERICNNDFCVVAPDVAEAAIVEVESAIRTAQSQLAGEVLAEVARWYTPAASSIDNRLRDLFARLNIKLEDK